MNGWLRNTEDNELLRESFYIKKSKEIRLKCLNMVKKAKRGHLGGTFSIIDILVVLYYGKYLQLYRKNSYRGDSVIIGKGHANLAFLNIWNELGFISDDVLQSYGVNGKIGGQLDTTNHMIIDNITGSLGHAIGIASGICLADRLNKTSYKSIAIVGDGEMEEGSIWESMNFASKQKLDNLLCIVDRNRLSVTHFIENDNLEEKAKSFGWNVYTVDGHNHSNIERILDMFFINRGAPFYTDFGKPTMIIANTIKGKGVSFMENEYKWHHGCPSDEEYEQAISELEI